MSNRARPILPVVLTALAVGLLCVGLPGLAKPPPPPPPPPTPQYRVLDLGVTDSYSYPVMNDQGQVAYIPRDGLYQQVVVITPRDSNGDGFWDSVSKLTIEMPDRAWFVDSLGLGDDQELCYLMFWGVAIGKDGVVSGTVGGYVYRPSDDEWSYEFYRGFVVKPADSTGDGINDVPLTDLGVGEVDPDVGDIGCFLSTLVFDMNESGCIVGQISTFHYDERNLPVYAEDTNHAFRIVPIDKNGDGIVDTWFEDTNGDGVNDLIEVLGESGSLASAVDDAGRVYVSNQDWSGFVVFPDGYESKTKSSLDRMWNAAGNSGGLAVGYYRTGSTYRRGVYTFPVVAPCMIQGLDTGGGAGPDLWFRDANNDGKNDLMVKLGTLSGYTDESAVEAVNDGGEIVGYAGSSTSKNGNWVSRALIWKKQVAVDLNTLIPPQSVVLREASAITQTGAITQKGAILCDGTDAAGAWHSYLLMP